MRASKRKEEGAGETGVGGTNLALKFEHQPEHTVGRRVLGPEVNGEVADLVVRDKHCGGRAEGGRKRAGGRSVLYDDTACDKQTRTGWLFKKV